MFNIENKTVVVFGGTGLVGSNLVRYLKTLNCKILHPPSTVCNLLDYNYLDKWFQKVCPDIIYMCAGLVGGIEDNRKYPVEYCQDNMIMGLNVVKLSYKHKVEKLVYLSSSCVYPTGIDIPMDENMLLTGKFEPTNEGYALAKISVSKLCSFYNRQYGTNYITIIPCNLYGTGDKYDMERGHVIGSLIYKFYDAKIHNKSCVEIWGHGHQRREIMHVDDLINGMMLLTKYYNNEEEPINIGIGQDYSIIEIANIIKEIVNYDGNIFYNENRPIGSNKKLLNIQKIKSYGWKNNISLKTGLTKSINEYKNTRI